MRNDLRLRKAGIPDCKDIFKWRNHPGVRKFSFNSSKVSMEEHKKWFDLKINDPKTKIYIAFVGDNKAGIIRFETKPGLTKVSVNLNPGYFGRGFGTKLIKNGTKKYFNETKIKQPVIAEIKKENIPSIKAFERAGYRLINETEDRFIYEKN